uniref:MATH domain-containing protein n=1 Tax=Kalanchoe fedtschenkoi TaxID=63787 RepID=A0A7N0UCJ3_KALFE
MADVWEQDGVVRTISDAPPAHYSVRIQNFSLLGKNSVDKYETGSFQAGGYKWKLILHPQGNKSKDVEDHISLYLQMAETDALPPGWEVHVVFRFFLLDQINDKYLALQDAPGHGRRFYKMKTQWGFDRFVTLKAFNDSGNGHLVDDCCVFGAEVFIGKEKFSGNGESLTMTKNVASHTHSWTVQNCSKLENKCYESEPFTAGGHTWKIRFFPKGKDINTHVSLFLVLVESAPLPSCAKVMVDFSLRILNFINSNHIQGKATHWFSSSSTSRGWVKFATQRVLNPMSNYTENDKCSIEAEVSVLGVADVM